MSTITNSMFESIKTALAKNTNSNSRNKDILKTEVGNTYTVRLLPNIKDPTKTFFHYYTFGWTSLCTGQYVSAVSPSTFGARDPIAETRYRILKTGTEEEKNKARGIIRSEKWLVNAYVINDPVNPDNNGKVMIVRYGKQLHKIITDAIEGEGSEDFGPRIFDLSSNGCNFIIKVEKQGDYPTYVSSKFTMPKAIDGLEDSRIDNIYNNAIDLTSVLPVKSFDEIQELLNEHFYCAVEKEDNDKHTSVVTPSSTSTHHTVADDDNSIDENKVNELLKGLDDLA